MQDSFRCAAYPSPGPGRHTAKFVFIVFGTFYTAFASARIALIRPLICSLLSRVTVGDGLGLGVGDSDDLAGSNKDATEIDKLSARRRDLIHYFVSESNVSHHYFL